MNKYRAGFTLIEVLIALLIIAIAMAGIIKAMQDSIVDTTGVQTRVYAQWAGLDVLSEMRLGVIPTPTNTNPTVSGQVKLFNQTFNWVAGISQAGSAYFERVYVNVSENKRKIRHLEGFLPSQIKEAA